jgi:transcriptional regulator with XRE-family HTH domain
MFSPCPLFRLNATTTDVEAKEMAGSELRKLRMLTCQSQYQLAKEAGVDRTRISLAENDYVKLGVDESRKLVHAVLQIMQRQMADLQKRTAEAEACLALFTQAA